MQHTIAQTVRREAVFARELGAKEPCKSATALHFRPNQNNSSAFPGKRENAELFCENVGL